LALTICLIFSDTSTIELCGRKVISRPHDLEVLSFSTKVYGLRRRRFQTAEAAPKRRRHPYQTTKLSATHQAKYEGAQQAVKAYNGWLGERYSKSTNKILLSSESQIKTSSHHFRPGWRYLSSRDCVDEIKRQSFWIKVAARCQHLVTA